MKILGINTSPRKGQTTRFALEKALESAREFGGDIQTEIIELGGMDIKCCTGCNRCSKALDCQVNDDFLSLLPKLTDEDVAGVIIGTPVYMGTMTGLCKDFLDRCVMLRRNGRIWQDKVGGVVAVGAARNGGQELTIQAVQAALMVQNMVIVSDGPGYCHFGATMWSGGPDGIENDEFGLKTVTALGTRVAQVAAKMNS